MKKQNTKQAITKALGLVLILTFCFGASLHAAEADARFLAAFSLAPATLDASSSFEIPTELKVIIPQKQEINLDASQYFKSHDSFNKLEGTLFEASMVSLAVLNVADYLSTRQALKYGGLAEGNPLMKPFVKNEYAFAAAKVALTVGNYFLMKKIHKSNKPMAWALSLISNFAMSYVVASNMKMIEKARNGSL